MVRWMVRWYIGNGCPPQVSGDSLSRSSPPPPLPSAPQMVTTVPDARCGLFDSHSWQIQIHTNTWLNSTLLIWQIQTQISGPIVKYSVQTFSSYLELFVLIWKLKILPLLTSLIKCQSNVNHTDELRFSLESFQIKLLSTAFTSFLNSDLSSFSLRHIITIKAWKRRGVGGHKYLVTTFDIKTLNLNRNQGRSCQEDTVNVLQQTAGSRDAAFTCHEQQWILQWP